jgi:regulator of protease activity HflC (stomatin/prohibitin superfamily)
MEGISVIAVVVVFFLFIFTNAIRILKEYERGVIFRLGRLRAGGAKGPGLILLWPIIDRMQKVDLRIIAHDVPPQDVITRDNVSVKVNAVVFFRVFDPDRSVIEVEDFFGATSQLAQTTLRSVIGEVELDQLLAERDQINARIQGILDEATDPWGIKVSRVEVKHVDLPQEMQRAIARQAEAERERRAKIIAADGEYQASEKLGQAAAVIRAEPGALQLRYLQTMNEIGSSERTTTLILPFPVEMLEAMLGHAGSRVPSRDGSNGAG